MRNRINEKDDKPNLLTMQFAQYFLLQRGPVSGVLVHDIFAHLFVLRHWWHITAPGPVRALADFLTSRRLGARTTGTTMFSTGIVCTVIGSFLRGRFAEPSAAVFVEAPSMAGSLTLGRARFDARLALGAGGSCSEDLTCKSESCSVIDRRRSSESSESPIEVKGLRARGSRGLRDSLVSALLSSSGVDLPSV